MKRFISLFLAASMALSLAACGMGNDSSSSMNSSSMGSSIAGSEPHFAGSGATSGAMSDIREDMGDLKEDITGSEPRDSMSQNTAEPMPDNTTSGSASQTRATQAAAPAAAFSEGEWSLTLVNASHPLPEGFSVDTVSIAGYDDRQFDARAAGALTALLDAAQADGCPLYLVSSYRSVERQTALFQRKTNYYKKQGLNQQAAEEEAAKMVARPGTSEHNLGLAADIVSADWYSAHSDLTQEFETTPAFAWLQSHAAEYGFILRYPAGKEAVTGVEYEPWHYRYVGPAAAAAIARQGITLEEYLGQ